MTLWYPKSDYKHAETSGYQVESHTRFYFFIFIFFPHCVIWSGMQHVGTGQSTLLLEAFLPAPSQPAEAGVFINYL